MNILIYVSLKIKFNFYYIKFIFFNRGTIIFINKKIHKRIIIIILCLRYICVFLYVCYKNINIFFMKKKNI